MADCPPHTLHGRGTTVADTDRSRRAAATEHGGLRLDVVIRATIEGRTVRYKAQTCGGGMFAANVEAEVEDLLGVGGSGLRRSGGRTLGRS